MEMSQTCNRGLINVWNPINQQYEINIPSSSHTHKSKQPQLNVPRKDLLNGSTNGYNEICIPLYKASLAGNQKAAEVILENRRELLCFSITKSYDTVIHIAVLGKSYRFIKYLTSLMTNEELELRNANGETAFYLAAIAGNVEVAEVLLKRNESLLNITDYQGNLPIHMAASFGKHDMVRYLYSNYQNLTSHSWTHEKQGWLLLKCVEANLFDVALQICTDHPELATNGSVLSLLARKRGAFYVIRPNIICRFMRSIFHHMVDIPDKENHALRLLRFILTEIGKLPMAKFDDIIMGPPDETDEGKKQTGCEKEMKETLLQSTLSGDVAKMSDNISNQVKINGADNTTTSKDANKRYSSPVLFVAAEIGNTEFVVEVIKQYPHLVTEVNENNQSIFHVAVLNGHEGIYKLLYEMGSINELIVAREDKNGNNMLHLVGRSSASKRLQNIQGVGLRLNPELLWFKEIETLIPPCLREKKNVVGLTPYEAFMNSNKDLFSKGEKWMKEIAAQLMVVAALIATISFAALFTFPGGYDQLTGLPIFLPKFHFKVFIICDSFSFICSTNSILMVLSILGSKYDEYDFLVSLSKRLIICLASVFISIVTLSIAFLINTFLLYTTYYHWMPVLISVLTCIGYAIFVFSNYHLLGRYMRGFRMLYETGASARKFHSD